MTRKITDPKSAADITRIHLVTFPNFFLTFLGGGFLQQLYKGFITHDKSAVIGAFDDDRKLLGFVAYSENISQFYKYLIKESLIPLAWYSFVAAIKRPSAIFRLLRAFTYPEATARDEAYIKLASIGVLPEAKKQGVGSLLISAVKNEISLGNFAYLELETDKIDNEAANAFYISNGFVLQRSFTSREGREMNEYRLKLQ